MLHIIRDTTPTAIYKQYTKAKWGIYHANDSSINGDVHKELATASQCKMIKQQGHVHISF